MSANFPILTPSFPSHSTGDGKTLHSAKFANIAEAEWKVWTPRSSISNCFKSSVVWTEKRKVFFENTEQNIVIYICLRKTKVKLKDMSIWSCAEWNGHNKGYQLRQQLRCVSLPYFSNLFSVLNDRFGGENRKNWPLEMGIMFFCFLQRKIEPIGVIDLSYWRFGTTCFYDIHKKANFPRYFRNQDQNNRRIIVLEHLFDRKSEFILWIKRTKSLCS